MAPDIFRLPGGAAGRSRAVIHGGFVWTVATARDKTRDLAGQTADALEQIAAALAECGTSPSRLLTATVYVTDIARKEEMDRAWRAWVPADGWPQRACVQAALAPGDLVKIVVMAALPPRQA